MNINPGENIKPGVSTTSGAANGSANATSTSPPPWQLFTDNEAFGRGDSLVSVANSRKPKSNSQRAAAALAASGLPNANSGTPKGLLSLQLLLLFSDVLRYVFGFEVVASSLAKFVIFPDSTTLRSTRLGEEIFCLFAFLAILCHNI